MENGKLRNRLSPGIMTGDPDDSMSKSVAVGYRGAVGSLSTKMMAPTPIAATTLRASGWLSNTTVEKATRNGRTISKARLLNDEQRLDEIASLFSGDRATPESREHARVLMSRK